MELYHGSSVIVREPLYGYGKDYNDYGRGFYCTENIELAKEWACNQKIDGFINQYEMNLEGLRILDLSDYTALHWLALLVEYRKFRMTTPLMVHGVKWLKEHYLMDLSKYDIVIGYRADDSYFSFAKAFLSNQISYEQLCYAMKLGELGKQFVLKSKKAFEKIQFVQSEIVDSKVYYAKRKARDDGAREAFFKERDAVDIEGLYMRDIVREGVLPNDLCLRC